MKLNINLRGQVRQTSLPKWRSLLPLFEAIMNSFQAIQESDKTINHQIVVECERENLLALDDAEAPFKSFTIRDTGVGFNDENFDSFNTVFSEHKMERGGKGLGRIMWLVAFERAEVDSVFYENDAAHSWRRQFIFDTNYDPDVAPPVAVEKMAAGTRVRLSGFRSPYKEECPKSAEALILRIVEHFILVLLRPDCPSIELHVDGIRHSINKSFQTLYKANASEKDFLVHGVPFKLFGFKLFSARTYKHRLIYSANSRGVLTESLDDFIPNLSSKLMENDGSTFVYLAIVQSAYLDQRVNNFRTDFDIMHVDAEDSSGQHSLLPAEIISKTDIRNECVVAINQALSEYIVALNEAKSERIQKYVKDEAPQYKPLMRYKNDFINKIAPNATKLDMEMTLHKELHQREVDIKKESNKLITGAEKLDDYEEYRNRLSDFIERYSELGTSALAHHVMHRKIMLDFLAKAISINKQTAKYPLEEVVHNIIFPMRSDDKETLYSQQNLWIVDEKLTFHTHIASDKQLRKLDSFASMSAKRPDLFIFDRKIAFSEAVEKNVPINSIVVIEFKKPQRDDYTDEKNPLDQVFDQIADIRSGQFLNDDGRPIRVANANIPASAYVICDITPKLAKVLKDRDASPTSDGLSYYGYHRTYQVYYEVIDYDKLVSDARKRNRIFFDRLNIDHWT